MVLFGNKRQRENIPPPWCDQTVCYVDIGARGGPPDSWLRLSGGVSYICFEPDAEEAELLETHFGRQKAFDAKVVRKALGSSSGEVSLHLTKFRPSSSLLRPNKAVVSALAVGDGFEVESVVPVRLGSLDDEMTRLSHRCDFIKADVQGYELEVLKGAENTLRRAAGCELEVSFIEVYEDQPLFAEVDQFMRSRGFFLADLERVWWRRAAAPADIQERGIMAYGNATYLKTDIGTPRDRGEALRNTLVCVATGLDELAHEIVCSAHRAGLVSGAESQLFVSWLVRRHRSTAFWTRMARRLSKVPGRRTAGRWLGLWSRSLAGESDTHADSESWLRRNSW